MEKTFCELEHVGRGEDRLPEAVIDGIVQAGIAVAADYALVLRIP